MRSLTPPKSLDNRLFLANVTMPASRLRALFLAILDPTPISQSPVQDPGRKTFALFRNHLILLSFSYRGNVRR